MEIIAAIAIDGPPYAPPYILPGFALPIGTNWGNNKTVLVYPPTMCEVKSNHRTSDAQGCVGKSEIYGTVLLPNFCNLFRLWLRITWQGDPHQDLAKKWRFDGLAYHVCRSCLTDLTALGTGPEVKMSGNVVSPLSEQNKLF